MKGPISSTNQTKLVCKTLVSTTRRFLENHNTPRMMSPLPYNIGDNVSFLLIYIVFTPQE